MGRVYAGWAVSQAFYREEVYLDIGYSSLEDYLVASWEERRLFADANDLLAISGRGRTRTSAPTRSTMATSQQPWEPSLPAPS